jgi:hypothetical protein
MTNQNTYKSYVVETKVSVFGLLAPFQLFLFINQNKTSKKVGLCTSKKGKHTNWKKNKVCTNSLLEKKNDNYVTHKKPQGQPPISKPTIP